MLKNKIHSKLDLKNKMQSKLMNYLRLNLKKILIKKLKKSFTD
jgi:hypothetical protein